VNEHSNDYNNNQSFGFLRQSGYGLGPYRSYVYLSNDPASFDFLTVWRADFSSNQAHATFLNGNSTVVQSASNNMGNFNY
jgi:hypothetical protein